jgi:hypothetical protein
MIRLGEVLVLTPSDGKSAPDAKDHLLQADRGNRKGQFYRDIYSARRFPGP